MMQANSYPLRLFLVSLFLLGALGCGEQVEDVNRVQPHYVKKSALDGDWYYRQTIVNRPPQVGIAFEGIEGSLEKIRFEFRESQLIAYRIHPNVEGLEDDRILDGAEYKGEPVAIFSAYHFDIIRDFSTTSGQQSNLISENMSLRPWYERDYVRVAWHTNILDGGVDFGGFFSAYSTAVEWIPEINPYDPDRFKIEKDFLFFTTSYTITDGGYSCLNGYGAPSGAGGYGNCGSVEIRVRNAFMKIDEEEFRQFEALDYIDSKRLTDDDGTPLRYVTATVGPNSDTVDLGCTPEVLAKLGPRYSESDCHLLTWEQMGRFGYFRSERYAYDRRVGGGHDLARQVYANHHQIWKATRRADGTVIPMAERELRPVVYYLNANFPDNLKATAAKIGANWDDAFMAAAVAGTGKTEEAIRSQLRAQADDSAVFVEADDRKAGALFQVRENQCSFTGVNAFVSRHPSMTEVVTNATRFAGLLPGNLERTCSALDFFSRKQGIEPFTWQQMGDLRFSFLWWVNEDQPGGPLGYGPSSADIETGRIISGNAYLYGAALDQYARSAADMVQAINGDLPLADVLDGEHLRAWMRRGSDAARAPMEATEQMRDLISERIGTPFMDGQRDFERADGKPDMGKMIQHMNKRLEQPVANDPVVRAMERPHDRKAVMMEAISGDPEMKGRFTDPEMLKLAGALYGWRPGMEKPEGLEELALELSLDPSTLGRKAREREQFYGEKNAFLADFLDDSVIGQASALKGKPAAEVYDILRREIFEAVALHEIGHTVGMTHNFEASFDALNYQKEFWEIETSGVSENEQSDLRQPEYRYASIMDYGSRFNSDTKGLGRYDFATIKFLYGQALEEFESDVPVPGHLKDLILLNDYRQIPSLLGDDIQNLWKRKDVSIDDSIASMKARLSANTTAFLSERANFESDHTVPYSYCADFFNGNLRCKTWDEGSNHTESVTAAIQRYWSYYAFNNFRRGRDQGSFINGFFGRMSRLMDYLTYPWQFYYFYDAYPVDVRDDLLNASLMGLNFINEVVGTPEPGEYCEYIAQLGTDENGEEGGSCQDNGNCAEGSVCRSRQCVQQPDVFLPAYYFSQAYQNACRKVDVKLGDGREQYFSYSEDYLYKIDYIGSYFEKSNLLSALFFDSTRFYRVTDESDTRRFSVGYYRVFREEIVKMIRDLVLGTLVNSSISNDQIDFLSDTIHARVVDSEGNLLAQPLVNPDTFTTTERAQPSKFTQLYTPVPYNLATQAALLGAVYNTTSYDQELDLIEYLAVSELGSGDERVTDGREQVLFVNPITGQGYVATQTWDNRSIGFEFLERLNVFVENDWRPALAQLEATPNSQDAIELFDRLDRQMNEFIEMVDYLREMRSMMDFAQGGGWR